MSRKHQTHQPVPPESNVHHQQHHHHRHRHRHHRHQIVTTRSHRATAHRSRAENRQMHGSSKYRRSNHQKTSQKAEAGALSWVRPNVVSSPLPQRERMVSGSCVFILSVPFPVSGEGVEKLFLRDSCKSGEKIIPKIFQKYEVFKIKF